MASKIEVMYPLTNHPFDKHKRYCRVCHGVLVNPKHTKWKKADVLYTIYYEALCSLECLLTMHKANEEQLDELIDWADKQLSRD